MHLSRWLSDFYYRIFTWPGVINLYRGTAGDNRRTTKRWFRTWIKREPGKNVFISKQPRSSSWYYVIIDLYLSGEWRSSLLLNCHEQNANSFVLLTFCVINDVRQEFQIQVFSQQKFSYFKCKELFIWGYRNSYDKGRQDIF